MKLRFCYNANGCWVEGIEEGKATGQPLLRQRLGVLNLYIIIQPVPPWKSRPSSFEWTVVHRRNNAASEIRYEVLEIPAGPATRPVRQHHHQHRRPQGLTDTKAPQLPRSASPPPSPPPCSHPEQNACAPKHDYRCAQDAQCHCLV